MAQTVAEQLVDTLTQAGVRRIYGIVGDSLNPVTDAIRRSGTVGQGVRSGDDQNGVHGRTRGRSGHGHGQLAGIRMIPAPDRRRDMQVLA